MTTRTKYPNPFYAAAGAGDLALEKLRELPEQLTVFTDRARAARGDVHGLRERATGELNQLGGRAVAELGNLSGRAAEARQALADIDVRKDLAKARVVAERNVKTFAVQAQKAYETLVARGTRVVDGQRTPAKPKSVTAPKTSAKKAPAKKAGTSK